MKFKFDNLIICIALCFILVIKIFFRTDGFFNKIIFASLISLIVFFILKKYNQDYFSIVTKSFFINIIICVISFFPHVSNDFGFLKIIFNSYFTSSSFISMNFVTVLISICSIIISKQIFNRSITLLILIEIFVFVFLNISLNEKLKIINYEIPLNNEYKNLSGLKIIQISDFHDTYYKNNNKDLLDQIQLLKPDFIFLSGDIVEPYKKFTGSLSLLTNLKDIAPVYYISGNHESRSSEYTNIINQIKQYGIEIMEDKKLELIFNEQKIDLYGIKDRARYGRVASGEWTNAIRFIYEESDNYKILLFHNPLVIKLVNKYNFNLIFSGHEHGGQFRVPLFVNGLYATDEGFLPSYAGGIYELKSKGYLIVSRGMLINKYPRLFNRPELVVVTLK